MKKPHLSTVLLIATFVLIYSGIQVQSDVAVQIGVVGLCANAVWNVVF